jgi:superfamily II DNA or RNA helicase
VYIEIQDENWAQFKDINDKVLWEKIRKFLSYSTPTYFGGRVHYQRVFLVHGITKKFSVGLIPLLLSKFPSLQVVDKRPKHEKLTIPLSDELEEYQRTILEQALRVERAVITLPTGSGKSYMISYLCTQILEKYPDKQICIIVPSIEILHQIKKNLPSDKTGLVWSNKQETDKPIIITTGQTLNSRFDEFSVDKILENVSILITDEAHHVGSNTFYKISFLFPKAFIRLGFSSTPKGRSDGADLKIVGVFSSTFLNVDSKQISRIVPVEILMIKYPVTTSGLCISMEYNDLLDFEPRKQAIIQIAKRLSSSELTWLMFVDRLSLGEELSKALDVPFVNASNPNRRDLFQQLQEKKILGIITTVGKEGLDIISLSSIINTSRVSTPIDIIQKVGRVRRRTEGKDQALVIDFYDDVTDNVLSWTKKRISIYKQVGNVTTGNL